MSQPKTTLVKVPKLKIGGDKEIAEILTEQHDRACEATKVIFDTGLFCYFIKSNLKHSEFGPWLQAHAPERLWRLNSNGKPVAASTLSWQMNFTRRLVETCKTTIGKLLSQIPKCWEFAHRGKFLQLPAGSSVLTAAPEPLVAVHAKACDAVEGKTAYQLFLEFKQADEDEDEDGLPRRAKPGRRKGQGGATKEQRARANAAEEAARIAEIELKSEEVAEWLDEHADAKGFGQINGTMAFAKLLKAMEHATGCMRRIMLRHAEKGVTA